MNTFARAVFCLLLTVCVARSADDLNGLLERATLDYTERTKKAAEELNATRERIAKEKAPLLQQLRAAEDRIIAAQADIDKSDTSHASAENDRRKLLKDADTLHKSTTYVTTLAHDGLSGVANGLFAGEEQLLSEPLAAMQAGFDNPSRAPSATGAVAVAEFILARNERQLGGYAFPGRAVLAGNNQVLTGNFAVVGPEVFFVTANGPAGVVRGRDAGRLPTFYPVPTWKAEDAAAFTRGTATTFPADASNGKALKLQQTSGTLWEHIQKGGIVAYAILAVGIVSLLMILQKLRELSAMKVDSRQSVQAFLAKLTSSSTADAKGALNSLRPSTRELFAEGLLQVHQPKHVLEERLQAVLLEQRLRYERRLPLLAVIATAAPLMGLLGTVVGMIKTFALITVFGTGNAGKLSTGISEVLVATELGLAVAIPTLVVHGFLAHRVHRNLSLLERHALQFVSAVEQAKTPVNGAVSRVSALS